MEFFDENEPLEELKALRKRYAISISNECKCRDNIDVNIDLLMRNLAMRKKLEELGYTTEKLKEEGLI
jgi:hypothetical protein